VALDPERWQFPGFKMKLRVHRFLHALSPRSQSLWFTPRAWIPPRLAEMRGRGLSGASRRLGKLQGTAAALLCGSTVFGTAALCDGHRGVWFDPSTTQRMLDAAWSGTDSYGEISEEEEDAILGTGAHWAYGEISFEGMEALLQHMGLSASDVFVDLGSGRGIAVAHSFLAGAALQSLGVEMALTRHNQAKQATERLCKVMNLLSSGPDAAAFWLRDEQHALSPSFEARAGERSLRLVHGDCLKVDLAGATAVYMANLTWPDGAVAAIGARLANTPSVRVVASLKPLDSLPAPRVRPAAHPVRQPGPLNPSLVAGRRAPAVGGALPPHELAGPQQELTWRAGVHVPPYVTRARRRGVAAWLATAGAEVCAARAARLKCIGANMYSAPPHACGGVLGYSGQSPLQNVRVLRTTPASCGRGRDSSCPRPAVSPSACGRFVILRGGQRSVDDFHR
jgi:hypothetical protein